MSRKRKRYAQGGVIPRGGSSTDDAVPFVCGCGYAVVPDSTLAKYRRAGFAALNGGDTGVYSTLAEIQANAVHIGWGKPATEAADDEPRTH